ncbi:MAG: LTA synthase family protein [Pseudomonadota bacterium]
MTSERSVRKFWRDPCLHILLLVLALVGFKLFALEMVSRAYMDCQWCLSTKAVTHESELVLILLAIHLLSCISRLRLVRVPLRLLLLLGLVITGLDLLVTHTLWTRLTLSELLVFAGEFGAVAGFLQQLLPNIWTALAIALAAGLVLVVFVRYLRDDRASLPPLFLYLLIGAGVVGCELVETREYHDAFLQNSVQVFFKRQTSTTPYSAEFSKTISAAPAAEPAICSKAVHGRSDVILLVFESLSMYHSALFSGINDWMPEFDAISKTGTRFSNFYANGVTSEQGLVSLLTGEPPIARGKTTKTLFEQFHSPVDSVPRMLHGLGYETVFLTTGNLGFMDKGKWLKGIGFDVVEGHEAPAYMGLKRYQFDAAPDDALYDRALTWLQEHKTAPVFMTLETVTTHMPNVDPETGARSQEQTYRYADRQLGNFVRSLRSSGFFDNGTLIITADHRAMVPLSLKEQALYGDRAYARVPMTVVGKGVVARHETASLSQSDLLPSLRNALGTGQQCAGANQGVFLPTVAHVPQCIYTNRSYDHNSVFVHCGASDFTVALNGDKTRFVDAIAPPPGLLPELHRLRLGQGFR